jgi:hypothetical protein
VAGDGDALPVGVALGSGVGDSHVGGGGEASSDGVGDGGAVPSGSVAGAGDGVAHG